MWEAVGHRPPLTATYHKWRWGSVGGCGGALWVVVVSLWESVWGCVGALWQEGGGCFGRVGAVWDQYEVGKNKNGAMPKNGALLYFVFVFDDDDDDNNDDYGDNHENDDDDGVGEEGVACEAPHELNHKA